MSFFLELHALLEQGAQICLVTVVKNEGSSPRKVGARMAVKADGSILGTIGGGTVELEVIRRALLALENGVPELYTVHLTRELGMCCGGAMSFLLEPLTADPTLLLFGAGHVAHELCPMAVALGFRVIVIDEREEYNNPERFPMAHRRVVEDPLVALEGLPTGPLVYAVIVTHLHRLDEDLLRHLAPKTFAYLGMIGSRAKVARFLERLAARGIEPEALARITMPIGLDLGALTPAEIAVSIAAELVMRRRRPSPALEAPVMDWRPGRG